MLETSTFRLRPLAAALATAFALAACGGGNDEPTVRLPSAPTGLGSEQIAAIPSGVLAYVDTGVTNTRRVACQNTIETNAGVRVLKGMLDIWAPTPAADGRVYVDAGEATPAGVDANGIACPASAISTWTGIPRDSTDGRVLNAAVHNANIDYVIDTTRHATRELAQLAYDDDRRGKGYSMSDGMGPLTSIWRTGVGQFTTINHKEPFAPVDDPHPDEPADWVVDNNPTATAAGAAPAWQERDRGNNVGVRPNVRGTANPTLAPLSNAVFFIQTGHISDGSVEPGKRYFKYARPYRWTTDVRVLPALESSKSSSPGTDSGFQSGHTAEAWRDALPMAYLFPQRFQELITRATEMGESRIVAGMHSPLDVMGGRIMATAVVAYSLNKNLPAEGLPAAMNAGTYRQDTFNEVQNYLRAQTGATDFNDLMVKARTPATTVRTDANFDRFSDHAWNKAYHNAKLTYGLPMIMANAGRAPTVPKGAEVLIETRLPYLNAAQRRVVLATTQIDSGHPLANDDEGWGRINLFDAADGYGAFNGDVGVTMDAELGGFHAADAWKNSISGAGLLTKSGTGALTLSGANTWTGGTVLNAGALIATSTGALGRGDVYQSGGTLRVTSALSLGGKYTQLPGSTLALQLGNNGAGRLTLADQATLQGNLNVTFASGFEPTVGSTINLITAGSLQGKFANISIEGYRVTPIYTAGGFQLRIDAAVARSELM